MGPRLVLGLLGILGVACGGKVVFVEETSSSDSDPPLSPLCQAAQDAVDWSACTVLSFDPWLPTSRSCENRTAIPACSASAEAYYGCIANTGGTCVPIVDEEVGSESPVVDIPQCAVALETLGTCLGECGAASVCEESPEACECVAPSPNVGTACCWYPDCPADDSLPSCFAVCACANSEE